MPDIPQALELRGCTPEPLSNYLKALGIFRLIIEHRVDAQAKAYWHNDSFLLMTQLSAEQLTKFFLHDYRPTPLVAPWNGSTGFYSKDNQKTISAFRGNTAERFALYQETIAIAQKQVDALGLTSQPKDEEKRRLLQRLRNHLPNEAVKWLDACALVTLDDLNFPPLTGTGGNDGNFEFSRTFMQQLQELFDIATGIPQDQTALLLKAAIFDETLPSLPYTGKIGQFNPIAAGGANAAPGYDADSRVNPWDYVLMLEGIMLFVAGATRRYEQSNQGNLSYPFTVKPASVGYGSAATDDKIRAELWVPLWSAPAGLRELQLLFGEGRAKVGGRAARDGVDFARAVSSLGVDRGINQFVRYSFQERNGLSYFAVPLGRFQPRSDPKVDRLTELDSWLIRLDKALAKDAAPASVKQAYRKLKTSMIDMSRQKTGLLEVLITLGEVEAALNRSMKFTKESYLSPISLLNSHWVDDCDDQSVEFRLAWALASNSLRERLVQVRQARQEKYPKWADTEDGITTWQAKTLTKNLITWVRRVEIEQQRQDKQRDNSGTPATESSASNLPTPAHVHYAHLDDLAYWINGYVDDQRLEAIARGLSLVQLPSSASHTPSPTLPIPTAFALIAIAHHRVMTVATSDDRGEKANRSNRLTTVTLPRVPGILPKLTAGDCVTATDMASRRLHASGLRPAIREGIYEPGDRTLRIAAALAFPIAVVDMDRLLQQIQRREEVINNVQNA